MLIDQKNIGKNYLYNAEYLYIKSYKVKNIIIYQKL